MEAYNQRRHTRELRNQRRVWEAVTANPRTTRRELADITQLTHWEVRSALETLRALGYIDWQKGHTGYAVLVAAGVCEVQR